MTDDPWERLGAALEGIAAKQDQLEQRIVQLDRRFESFTDELRQRIQTMETAFLNEVRSLGQRVRRIEDAA